MHMSTQRIVTGNIFNLRESLLPVVSSLVATVHDWLTVAHDSVDHLSFFDMTTGPISLNDS